MPRPILLSGCCLLLLVACQRQAAVPAAHAPKVAAATAPAPAAPAPLQDVIEHDPRYMIGISYPPVARQYPGLAQELQRYADAARAELMQAVAGLGNHKPTAPYELSLGFTELLRTPQMVAIAADGSSYTGGAHGNPLIARFVWLPQQREMLTIEQLIPNPKDLRDLSTYVRAQLHAAVAQRMDSDDVAPADRAELARNAGQMIDEGTAPKLQNFAQFEPVMDAGGRISALRFVFPPYQVGPYADGTQTVDVPADVLLPKVATTYRSLFAGG